MGTYDSLYTALSGMNANQQSISVIGDNLANLNTFGFKASRASFQDVLGQTLVGSAGSSRVGQGVSLQGIDQIHSQGGFQSTGQWTDLAISGNGFFTVTGPDGGQFYTRNGQFQLDNDLRLMTANGLNVQGYMADADGNLSASMTDLDLGGIASDPKATTEVDLQFNLPKGDEAIAGDIDPSDSDTFSRQSSFMIYDSAGEAHQVEVYFAKNDDGTWDYSVQGDPNGTGMEELSSGSLAFGEDGKLTAATAVDVDYGGQTFSLDFGDPATGDATTSQSGGFSTHMEIDGYSRGSLETVDVGPDGVITGSFDNGQTRVLARVGLSIFDSPQGLDRVGGNLFAATPASGVPTFGGAGEGGRGDIIANALETSNVDLSQEFVSMITAQRGFQAASRTITTVDQLLTEVVNLKR